MLLGSNTVSSLVLYNYRYRAFNLDSEFPSPTSSKIRTKLTCSPVQNTVFCNGLNQYSLNYTPRFSVFQGHSSLYGLLDFFLPLYLALLGEMRIFLGYHSNIVREIGFLAIVFIYAPFVHFPVDFH